MPDCIQVNKGNAAKTKTATKNSSDVCKYLHPVPSHSIRNVELQKGSSDLFVLIF